MKDVSARGVGSFADDVFLGLDDARGEPGERGYYLKGRARRIKASRCAVVERLIRSLDEISPDLRVWLKASSLVSKLGLETMISTPPVVTSSATSEARR